MSLNLDCSTDGEDFKKFSMFVYWVGKFLNCDNIVLDHQHVKNTNTLYMIYYFRYEDYSMEIEIVPNNKTLNEEEIDNLERAKMMDSHSQDTPDNSRIIAIDVNTGITHETVKFLLDYSVLIKNIMDERSYIYKNMRKNFSAIINTSHILSHINIILDDNFYREQTDYLLLFKIDDKEKADDFIDMWRHTEDLKKNHIIKHEVPNLSVVRSPFDSDTSIILGIRCNEKSTLFKTKLVKDLWKNFYAILPNFKLYDLESTTLYNQITS